MIDPRIAARYARLRALQRSPSPHEAASAKRRADRLEAAHGLSMASLRAYAPGGQVVVRGFPWWGFSLLNDIAGRLHRAGELGTCSWLKNSVDARLVVVGSRRGVEAARMLYVGARVGILLTCEAERKRRPFTWSARQADALAIAATDAFTRALNELDIERATEKADEASGPGAIVLWRASPEVAGDTEAAAGNGSASSSNDGSGFGLPPPAEGLAEQLRALYVANMTPALAGDALGRLLARWLAWAS